MPHIYSDPSREHDEHALPNIEIYQVTPGEVVNDFELAQNDDGSYYDALGFPADPAELSGWYWRACFPGCMPDSEANGPFDTEADAIADAQRQE